MTSAKRYSPTECFEFYGVKPRNIQLSWSARSVDGKTVAVRLWQDFFKKGVYCIADRDPQYDGRQQAGRTELIENLKHAIEHCDSLVRVIVLKAKDKLAVPRSIAECFPAPKIIMRIENFDEKDGTAILRLQPSS